MKNHTASAQGRIQGRGSYQGRDLNLFQERFGLVQKQFRSKWFSSVQIDCGSVQLKAVQLTNLDPLFNVWFSVFLSSGQKKWQQHKN